MKAFVRVFILKVLFLYAGFAFALQFPMPSAGEDIVGQTKYVTVQQGDTLTSLAQQYDVGPQELREANPNYTFDEYLPQGAEITVPTQFILPPIREGIVINLAELRLYYFDKRENTVYTFPVGVGRQGWQTPVASSKVVRKKEDPTWYVPESIKAHVLRTKGRLLPDSMPPGPENPLGKYALYLALPGYLIHGTNVPASVGRRVSSGCIRMPDHGIETLFQKVPIGTPVHIINEPVKVGWKNELLYMESHWPLEDYSDSKATMESALKLVSEEQVEEPYTIVDWQQIRKTMDGQRGVPEVIGFEQE